MGATTHEEFARAGGTDRIARLKGRLRELGWQAVFLPPGEDLHYVAGFTTGADERPAFLAVTRDRAAFLMPALNEAQARSRTDLPMFSYSDEEGPGRAIDGLWAELGLMDGAGGRFGVGDAMRADFLLLLQDRLPKGVWSPASEAVAPLRMVKDAGEIARLEHVAALTDRAMRTGLSAVRPGATEREVAARVREAFVAEGAEEVLFCSVASGPNSAFPHHHAADRRIEADDAVWLDIGCRVDGYCSDITRMAVTGSGPDGYAEVHAAVEAAVAAAFDAARPGVPLKEVDRAAREVIAKAGYGEYFVHRTGHGLGLSGHELPSVHGRNETQIEPGMVFSIEPGIYLPGRFGVRLEEIAVVEPHGARRLSSLPREAHLRPGPGGSAGA